MVKFAQALEERAVHARSVTSMDEGVQDGFHLESWFGYKNHDLYSKIMVLDIEPWFHPGEDGFHLESWFGYKNHDL